MDIYSMDLDGGALARLTTEAKPDGAPAWSPNSSRIAFHSVRDGDVEIYAIDADGGNQARLTARPGWDADPAWSPSGRRLAFVRSLGILDQRLYTMDADGAKQVRLMGNRQVVNSPSWSSDGARIAYSRLGDVWTMDSEGGDATQLTWRSFVKEPSWSPDGSRIAFADGRRPQEDIYAMPAHGEADALGDRVTDHPGRDMSPCWSPDSTQLAFVSDRDGNDEIYVLTLGTGARRRLTDNPELDGAPAWHGTAPGRDVSAVSRQLITWGWLRGMGSN